jgi:chromosome segregation ATPase
MTTDHGDGRSEGHSDDPAGAWLTISAAARRMGISRRAVQKRIERSTIRWRPDGNRGRLVFVPLSDGRGDAHSDGHSDGRTSLMATSALSEADVVPVAELDSLRVELAGERQRREATERELAAVQVALARAEGQFAARAEVVDALRADKDRLVAEVADLRRPWLARLLDALRQRRTSPGL